MAQPRPFVAHVVCALLFMFMSFTQAQAEGERFVLATTTSTENTGLLDVLVERFSQRYNIAIDVIAVGTGQALEIGRRGDAAALLVHDRGGEEQFIADGYGIDRRDVMFNDFVIIGPTDDPAGVGNADGVLAALKKIADAEALFVSRGDDSGTHRRERRLWSDTGQNPETFGAWYRETGSGMGNTLLTSVELGAYALTDRSTWIQFNRKGEHRLVLEGDPPLHNPYSSILTTHPSITGLEAQGARLWHEWLTSDEGQAAISSYRVDGIQLFFIAP